MIDIAKAIIVVGLACVSAWTGYKSDWEQGKDWGLLAFLVLIFG